MTSNRYSEVSQDTIDHLKLLGFTHLQLVLLNQENPYQATVEIIPGHDQGHLLDTVCLLSDEIRDFRDWQSPMTKYVIKRDFEQNF